MERKELLLENIKELEAQLEPLKDELRKISLEEQVLVEEKVKRCGQLKDKFTPDELIFAAYTRCPCGAGMAYPKNIGVRGNWDCSAILLGEADINVQHEAPLPFAFYEIKSEQQPSANKATTRKTLEENDKT